MTIELKGKKIMSEQNIRQALKSDSPEYITPLFGTGGQRNQLHLELIAKGRLVCLVNIDGRAVGSLLLNHRDVSLLADVFTAARDLISQ